MKNTTEYTGPERRLLPRANVRSNALTRELDGFIARMIREGTTIGKGVTSECSIYRGAAKIRVLNILDSADISPYENPLGKLYRRFGIDPVEPKPGQVGALSRELLIRKATTRFVEDLTDGTINDLFTSDTGTPKGIEDIIRKLISLLGPGRRTNRKVR